MIAICVFVAVALIVSVYFDVFESFERWAQAYERWQVDEIIVVPMVLSVAFGLYSWRRSRELKESEVRFEALVQNASDLVTIVDADGTILYKSPSVERIFGYKPDVLVGTAITEFIHPGDVEKVWGVLAETVGKAGVTPPIEVRARHRDGSWRYIEAIANNLLHDPDLRGIVVNSRDVTERKLADQILRRAEANYRTLTEQIPAVVYRQKLGQGNEMTYVSPRVEEMLGYSARELTADPDLWVNALHAEDRARVLAEDTHCAETNEPFSLEYRFLRRDGRVVWVRDEAEVVRDREGRELYWQGVLLDVSERRRAEERYAVLVNNIPAVAYVEDLARGCPVYMSPRVEDLVGYAPERFTDAPEFRWEIMHPDDRERALAENARADGTGDQFTAEYRMIARDGNVVWVRDEAVLIREEPGGAGYWQGVMLDITERKQAETKLREAEEKYRTLVEQTPAVTYIEAIDHGELEHDILYVSPQIEQLLGYSQQECTTDNRMWERLLRSATP